MKKILLTTLLPAFVISPAFALDFEPSKLDVGAGYGLGNGGVLSIRGDYDIADRIDNPIKLRIGYNRYSNSYSGYSYNYSWSYNVLYAGAYYDFNELLNLGEKIHPFSGLGFGFGSVSCSGSCGYRSSPSTGGFYYIGGVQYDINKQFSAEASYSAWSGLSLGVNYHF